MKNKVFTIVFVVCILLARFVVPAGAQSEPPATQALQASPEMQAWAADLAVRGGWLGLVILLDLILGVVCALKNRVFQWQRLADFLSDYGPKIVGWLCLEALGLLPTEYAAMAGMASALGIGAYAIILISGVGSILTNVQSLGLLPANVPGVKSSH